MRLLLLLFVSVGIVVSLNSCKRDKDCDDPTNPDCSNYNPCHNSKPVTAEIEISQTFPSTSYPDMRGVSIEEEKLKYGFIKFKSLSEGDCTWILGAETITNKGEFVKTFSEPLPFGMYDVTLIIKSAPNKRCFPNDDGIDTLKKTFELVPVCKLLTTGIFKGVWDNEVDSTVVSIRPINWNDKKDSCYRGHYQFANFRNQNDTFYKSGGDVYQTNSTLAVRDISDLTLSRMDMAVNPKTLKTDLLFSVIGTNELRKFKGRRIAD